VLTWLTTEALSRGRLSARASCRTIAEGTALNKTSSIRGTAELVALRLIAKRDGTATRSAAYILRYAETLRMGGSLKQPPVERFPQNQSDHPGSFKLPPDSTKTGQNALLFDSDPGVLSIDRSSFLATSSVIDRSAEVFHTPAQRAECSALMRGFVIHRLGHHDAHPPDKKMLSMMLCVCEWEHLKNWLEWMTTGVGGRIKARRPDPPDNLGSPYAWLLKVAINHMHGIEPAEQKPTLELLRGGKQMYTRWHSEGLK
jgi:hypothetical protein